MDNELPMDIFVYWIRERLRILYRKNKGRKAPWTKDEILATYRFCNVHREDDRVTVWIRENWREGEFKDHKDLWFAMVVARLFNEPATLSAIEPFVLPFRPMAMRNHLKNLREHQKIFNAAYVVSTNGHAMDKVDYLIDRVLTPLWQDRRFIRPRTDRDSLASWAKVLREYDGFAGFMAGQIVADLKYHAPLIHAHDWKSFALSGPGSRRGMNRLLGRPVDQRWKEDDWHEMLMEVQRQLIFEHDLDLHAQDIQNCLCEFDKYMRARTGEGSPKQIYNAK